MSVFHDLYLHLGAVHVQRTEERGAPVQRVREAIGPLASEWTYAGEVKLAKDPSTPISRIDGGLSGYRRWEGEVMTNISTDVALVAQRRRMVDVSKLSLLFT